MQFRRTILLGAAISLFLWAPPLHAQYGLDDEDCGNDCRLNSNLAMMASPPAGRTADVAATGWGAVAGVGWNINKRSALIGEFMWNRMNANDAAIQAIKAAVQPVGTLSGSADLFAVTGNYRFELRGRWFGAYVIGGGGWYLRSTNLSESVTLGTTTVCTNAWLWWGFRCSQGTVTAGQTLAGSNSNVLGGNAGAGVTVGIGHAPYRVYAEARYHYAPTQGISTQFVGLAFGIRY
ncbi:MAG TPA: hypothetical protein VFL42_10640 [Terriglobales bacterium]|nr:hypothetical protein [Terriglobales bacterium]